MWLIASELAGEVGFPTTARRARDLLNKLSEGKPDLQRKRQGSKAIEFHISLLPPSTQAALLKKTGKVKVGEQVINLPKAKAEKPYCRDALWASWGKTNDKTKQKAQQALRCVQAVKALEQNGINRMHAYQTVCVEYGIP
ncbi:DNA-binding protein, partial [Vibrio cholerae]|uniref:DNA-binding protein n=1 Tax=Vibrio cholerae TaxID=666 RepID=UPI002234478E